MLSTTSRSRSVALSPSLPFSARIKRFARIGIVLRRSTTRCTCPIDFRSAARSTVTFMSDPKGSLPACAGHRNWRVTLLSARPEGPSGRLSHTDPRFPKDADGRDRPGHRTENWLRGLLLQQPLQQLDL